MAKFDFSDMLQRYDSSILKNDLGFKSKIKISKSYWVLDSTQ